MDKMAVRDITVEDDRTGLAVQTIRRALADNLYYVQGKFPEIATRNDYYMALSYTVRDRLLQRWLNTLETYIKKDVRVVAYLSAEFLVGPHLHNAMINMGIYDQVLRAVEESGLIMKELIDQEEEPGLGNGGLGRLAACYMDSLATLEIPAIGYGIRYEFGIFDQDIRDGWQVEITDKWLRYGNPWEIARPQAFVQVKLGGYTRGYTDADGNYKVNWIPARTINGVPYDTPIPGYHTNTANTLRLWRAEAPESFDLHAFNQGDYLGAVNDKMISENISKVLYPNDNSSQGKQLRLEQQYFFVSCSLQDMIRLHLREGDSLDTFHKKFAVQLNDTHPSIGVAELMRLLVDEHGLEWDRAWEITTRTFGYTNHTLLPEALEKWPIALFASLLPRHLEIIFEINRRFLDDVKSRFPGDDNLLRSLSLIDESGERYVRMANLASVGSHSINGVAALHTELLKKDVLKDFYKIRPEKFNNKTNGVTPRRWMVLANPGLTELINKKIGDGWITNLDDLKKLEKFSSDAEFHKAWQAVKNGNKRALAEFIHSRLGLNIDPRSLFDVQVKRIHEYKRQHLNALHIIALYDLLRQKPKGEMAPRTFIFGGKAAPGYYLAKLIIKLINSVADVVNNDPKVKDLMKVVYLPDFNVTLGQRIYPAADLSEQISLAGKEASGTGNMKFAMNGALTIGTLDGANVEIREEVGADNFFLFGMTADEAVSLQARGYNPYEYYANNEQLKSALDLIAQGYFSHGDRELFKPFVDAVLHNDQFMALADFDSYVECQRQVGKAYLKQKEWTTMSILNVARMGKFSSDRAIREYCADTWDAQKVTIELKEYCQSEAGLKV
ncbi:MAG TPA: glycogen/starch/alpha-glucan phosphorylase [Candidatus Obscuribacterales bacterium]